MVIAMSQGCVRQRKSPNDLKLKPKVEVYRLDFALVLIENNNQTQIFRLLSQQAHYFIHKISLEKTGGERTLIQ